jgi:hypothetical protein
MLRAEHRWECPNCTQTAVTHEHRPHTQMHTCPGLFMLTAPMVEAGTKADVRAIVRDDYLAGAIQTTDDTGRPISGIVRVRDDGQDCWAQAEAARITITN